MINKKLLKNFRKDFKDTVKDLENKYNLNIELGSISYTDIGFTAKIESSVKEIDGKTGAQLEFEKYCHLYGLSPTDYNRELRLSGKIFKLVGLNTSARKNVYSIQEKATGKKYIASNVKDNFI